MPYLLANVSATALCISALPVDIADESYPVPGNGPGMRRVP